MNKLVKFINHLVDQLMQITVSDYRHHISLNHDMTWCRPAAEPYPNWECRHNIPEAQSAEQTTMFFSKGDERSNANTCHLCPTCSFQRWVSPPGDLAKGEHWQVPADAAHSATWIANWLTWPSYHCRSKCSSLRNCRKTKLGACKSVECGKSQRIFRSSRRRPIWCHLPMPPSERWTPFACLFSTHHHGLPIWQLLKWPPTLPVHLDPMVFFLVLIVVG